MIQLLIFVQTIGFNFGMDQPIHPDKLFRCLLGLDFSELQCIGAGREGELAGMEARREQYKRDIFQIQKSKRQYQILLEKKEGLTATLKDLLASRKQMDQEHQNSKKMFEHNDFPYRNHLYIKQQLNQQRMINIQKRRQIKICEEQVRKAERQVERRKIEKENVRIKTQKVSRQKSAQRSRWKNSINKDCDEDFWIRRIEKMKNLHLNSRDEQRRAKIKHNYNITAKRSNSSSSISREKTCPACSDLNIYFNQSSRSSSKNYTKQALLSPRYTSIYTSRFRF